jgi:hypothetical protein
MESFKYVLTQLPQQQQHQHQQRASFAVNVVAIGDVLLQMALVEDMRGEYAQAKEILDKLVGRTDAATLEAKIKKYAESK